MPLNKGPPMWFNCKSRPRVGLSQVARSFVRQRPSRLCLPLVVGPFDQGLLVADPGGVRVGKKIGEDFAQTGRRSALTW